MKTSPQTQDVQTIARLLDVTVRYVQEMAQKGIIPKAAHGKYPVIPCVHGYIHYLRGLALKGDSDNVVDLEKSRRRKLAAEAELAELELAKAREAVISVEIHGKVVGNICDIIRTKLLSVPSKIAPAVALETDQGICKNIIDDEVRGSLTELARFVSDESGRTPEDAGSSKSSSKKTSSSSKTNSRRVGRPRKGAVA